MINLTRTLWRASKVAMTDLETLKKTPSAAVLQPVVRKLFTRFVSQAAQSHQSRQSVLGAEDKINKLGIESWSEVTAGLTSVRTKSLHVALVHEKTTYEEFYDAFAGLDGLQAVHFDPGARLKKRTGHENYGVLHFRGEATAAAALEELRRFPVRIHGVKTKVSPRDSKMPTPGEASHVLRISDLPHELRYDDVAELLNQRSLRYESIRFSMTLEQSLVGSDLEYAVVNPDGEFHGCVNIVFDCIFSAVEARSSLLGCRLGGTMLMEHDFGYGSALFEGKPTTRLKITAVPKNKEARDRLNDVLQRTEGVMEYSAAMERAGQSVMYRGYTIIDCKDVSAAWRIVKHVNQELPRLRVTFLPDDLDLGRVPRRRLHTRLHASTALPANNEATDTQPVSRMYHDRCDAQDGTSNPPLS